MAVVGLHLAPLTQQTQGTDKTIDDSKTAELLTRPSGIGLVKGGLPRSHTENLFLRRYKSVGVAAEDISDLQWRVRLKITHKFGSCV